MIKVGSPKKATRKTPENAELPRNFSLEPLFAPFFGRISRARP
jgi:hypothetical protein